MDSERVLRLALELARQDRVPADSGILVPSNDLTRVMVGIDIDSGDLMAARELGFDGVIAHHPLGGQANLGLLEVFGRHADILVRHGVPPGPAEAAVAAMRAEHGPRLHALNHDRVPSVARLLRMPLMSIHNPADELGRRRIDERLREKLTEANTVSAAVETLRAMPEFAKAATEITVELGREEARLGRFLVSHGAGTNGGHAVAAAAFRHGIDTVFYIHIDAAHLARLRQDFPQGKNLVVLGHIAADSVGLNPLIHLLRTQGLRVEAMGGVIED